MNPRSSRVNRGFDAIFWRLTPSQAEGACYSSDE